MKKALVFLVIFVTIFSVASLTLHADGQIVPFYNNVNLESTTFDIADDGTAEVTLYYSGRAGLTKGATITTKIQKYVSGNWVDVNIGTTNNEWVDNSSSFIFNKSHSTQLTVRGKYRACVTYEIWGNGGDNDIIVREIEKTY